MPVYKSFCKVVFYTKDLKCKEKWNLYSKQIEATPAPIHKNIGQIFFLSTLDTNINCMDWNLIFNIIQQGTQVGLYKYIPYNNIYHKYYQNPLKNTNYKHTVKKFSVLTTTKAINSNRYLV